MHAARAHFGKRLKRVPEAMGRVQARHKKTSCAHQHPSSLPTKRCCGARQKLSRISTVTNQGKARWMIIDEAFDADKLIAWMPTRIKNAGKGTFRMVDKFRV